MPAASSGLVRSAQQRCTKTQASSPDEDAVLLLCALLRSGQIILRRIDGATFDETHTRIEGRLRSNWGLLKYRSRKLGSETSNADIVERMINAWNAGNLDLAASFIAPDGINHSPPTEGISAWRQSWVKAREMFPDMRVRIEQTVSQGDTVCHRYTMMATAPNGRKVEILGLDMVRVRDGKIVEHWALADSAGLAAQMG